MATTASMPRVDARTEKWFAVLGRRDRPTDGVEDYCNFLGRALAREGILLESVRVPWFERGWLAALRELWRESKDWTGNWVLLQYTAMAWSSRGFPFGAAAVMKILRHRGVRTAVIFHEAFRQGGPRLIDRCRGVCQDWVIQALYKNATKAIFPDPIPTICWIPKSATKASFIPIGANISERTASVEPVGNRNGGPKTVVVFCLSDLPNRTREIGDLSQAMRCLQDKGVAARIVFLGRGTEEARDEINQAFRPYSIDVANLGLQSSEDVTRILGESDAMLCVRGPLYPRRGSAIAGIACGLPIVAYSGAAAGTPLEEAGVRLVPYADREALGQALLDVLTSETLRMSLHEMSLQAHRRHFSWETIAASMRKSLGQVGGAET